MRLSAVKYVELINSLFSDLIRIYEHRMFFEKLTWLCHGTKLDELSHSSNKALSQDNLSDYKHRIFSEYINLCWSLTLCSVSMSFAMCVGPDRFHSKRVC